jgi:ATP-dependent Clp protease protease subunit
MPIKRKNTKKTNTREINIEQVLLHSRQVFLTGDICEESSLNIVVQLIALQEINKKPIVLWINSCGGDLASGYSIIATMRMSTAPIITIINGEACSMAGNISLYGHRRYITSESWWMAHDVASCQRESASKLIARTFQLQKEQCNWISLLKEKTKLTAKDLEIAQNQELWLSAIQCKEKGIVDDVL